jgi:hypothetical protein
MTRESQVRYWLVGPETGKRVRMAQMDVNESNENRY